MPGVLQVEALAQTMAVYVAKQEGFGDRIGLFAGIDEVRFKRIVVPGDTLRLGDHDGEARSRFGKGAGWPRSTVRSLVRASPELHHPERRSAR